MRDLGRLVLLLAVVAMVAAASCWITSELLGHGASRPGDFHHWIHSQLDLTVDQDNKLEKEEDRFAGQRRELVETLQKDNSELAEAIATDREYSPRVMAAVEKIHHAQSALEEATLQHIFAMKPILSPEQFDKLLKLTSEALKSPSEL